MTGNPNSTLAKNTHYHLNVSVQLEACPLQLAPTSSTTAAMVMGDALAVALMKVKNFKEVNFAKFHPGGSLGRRLIQTVVDVMKKDNLPVVLLTDNVKDIIHVITKGKCGLVAVEDKNKKLIGVISDGDIAQNKIIRGAVMPLGYDNYEKRQYGNKDFILNSIDYLLEEDALIEVRTRELKMRLLGVQKINKERSFWQLLNLIAPILLILIFGLVKQYLRKKKYAHEN